MECPKAEYLVHGYLDGELELSGSYEFERHIEQCPSCADRLAREQALRRRFADTQLHFRSPPSLQAKVEAALDRTQPVSSVVLQSRSRPIAWLVAAALVVTVGLAAILQSPSAETLLARQVRDGHVRSLLADHLKDVDSSDQHTVKPWFAGRLDFAPWTADLAEEGFPLKGGRLDYIDNRRVAAIVFQRREHVINLFVWPADGKAGKPVRFVQQSNFQMFHWSEAGMTYWTVSDLNAGELADFVALVRRHALSQEPAVPQATPGAMPNAPGEADRG